MLGVPTKGGAMKAVVSTTALLVPTLPSQLLRAGVSRSVLALVQSPASSSRVGICASEARGRLKRTRQLSESMLAKSEGMTAGLLALLLLKVLGGAAAAAAAAAAVAAAATATATTPGVGVAAWRCCCCAAASSLMCPLWAMMLAVVEALVCVAPKTRRGESASCAVRGKGGGKISDKHVRESLEHVQDTNVEGRRRQDGHWHTHQISFFAGAASTLDGEVKWLALLLFVCPRAQQYQTSLIQRKEELLSLFISYFVHRRHAPRPETRESKQRDGP